MFYQGEEYKALYEKGKFSKPEQGEDGPSEKYFLDWCNFVYAAYSYGTTVYRNGGITRFRDRSIGELRMYGRGNQPEWKYRGLIDVQVSDGKVSGLDGAPVRRESILNISWDNVKLYQKFRDYAISKLIEQDYEPVVRAADSIANTQRRIKYFKDRLAADQRMKQLFQTAGYTPKDVSGYSIGMDPAEIDMMNELGAYGLDVEILLQDVLGASLDMAGYDEIKMMLAKDMIDLNQQAMHVCALPGEGRIGLKYVDPAGLILPMSAYNDHRDAPYMGYVEHIPISELRMQTGLNEKEIYQIAKKYSGYKPNSAMRTAMPNFTNIEWRQSYLQQYGTFPYDNFSVCVMNLYFIANEAESCIVGTEEINGEVQVQTETVPVQYVYKCKWIVGSTHVFDYGKDDTIVRVGAAGNKRAMLPIIAYSGDGPSITERCISFIDDIQLATLKLRAMFANIPPGPRLAIDMSTLEDSVRLGNQTFGMREMLSFYSGRGVLIYRSKSEFANPDMGAANRRPIDTMQSGAQEDFNLFTTSIQSSLDMIRQLTGVSEYADGSGDLRRVGNAAAESAAESSNNALKPYITEGFNFYRSTIRTMAAKYQMFALNGTIEMKWWPAQTDVVKVLNITPDIAMYDLRVDARPLPTQRDIQIMEGQILQFQQERKLNEADVMILLQMLRERDTKKAAVFMARAVAKNEAIIMQQQQQIMQQQQQGQIAIAQAAEQSRGNSLAMEIDGKGRLQEAKHRQQIELEKVRIQGQKELLALQSQLNVVENNVSIS